MATGSQVAGLLAVLEADLRQLSHDARKAEGFAGFFGSSDNQPEVKEAAERAVMKVRALADHPGDALNQIRSSKARERQLCLPSADAGPICVPSHCCSC